MPFVLKNSPAMLQHVTIIVVFQRQMAVCPGVSWWYRYFIQGPEEKWNLSHTKMDLTLFKKSSVAVKLKECAFFTNRIENLGQVVKLCQVKVANHTVNAIYEWRVLRTATQLRSFWRLSNLFRLFFFIFCKYPVVSLWYLKRFRKKNFDFLTKTK